jgi:uncharacterized protein YjbJ (UPF0337 family)
MDRLKGAAEQAKDSIKEVAGKVTADTKLETKGKADRARGEGSEYRRWYKGHTTT